MRLRLLLFFLTLTTLTLSASAALNLSYSSGAAGKSVTSSNTEVIFTDNVAGGTGVTFNARTVLIRSRGTSANTCAYNFLGTATASSDHQLPPGAAVTWTSNSDGWAGVNLRCAAAETATFDVDANP